MKLFRKKEAAAIAALIAARPNGLSAESLNLHPQTLGSMRKRKIVLRFGGVVRIHPNVEAAMMKDAEKIATQKEFEAIKRRIDDADFLVHVETDRRAPSCTVTFLTDTGRLYKATAPYMLEAAKAAFEAKDRHEALKEELNTWRNF